MKLYTLLDQSRLAQHILDGHVRAQTHPEFGWLRILNYTEKAAYDGVWDDVTTKCRGLIYDTTDFTVIARPFPKFFNHGQPGAPELDLHAPAVVTEKMDGSLGILYPTPDGPAIATRGSFASEQALHATAVLRERYAAWEPHPELTYLFEIIYPENRIVCDYGDRDDLVLLEPLHTASGVPTWSYGWPGPRVDEHPYRTLAEALAAEPRPNSEGFVLYFPNSNERLKIKQDDYVALHRILTGTNARNVWEVAAVHACSYLIKEPKHWGSFLGIDPARAAQVLALGDDWLAGVPDEFHVWVRDVMITATNEVKQTVYEASETSAAARAIKDRRARYEFVRDTESGLVTEIMRLASQEDAAKQFEAVSAILLRAWREACPEPTSPFARTEDVA